VPIGYTHYFPQTRSFSDDEWEQITNAAMRCVSTATAEGILLADGLGTSNTFPTIDGAEICFNGSAEAGEDYETFRITKDHDTEFNFCKTAMMPYDKVVVAILAVCEKVAPGALGFSSDGDDEDLEPGRQLALSVLPISS
jgi:hypothetical protein